VPPVARSFAPDLPPAYRGVLLAGVLPVRAWGRLRVDGLEHLPPAGPVLLAGNHDSYWDPIAVGIAAAPVRQVHALAKSTLWGTRPAARLLDAMGQIPIDRGAGDVGAMQRAIEVLAAGGCIGVFPEGTRSLGRPLRARSGLARLAEAVPQAEVVCCSVVGTTDITAVPRRPAIRVRFFRPAGGGLQPGEDRSAFVSRVLTEIRAEAPVTPPGRKQPLAA
jgi:1-acyl-sn-glycerol-3-phosphate acyltransferase